MHYRAGIAILITRMVSSAAKVELNEIVLEGCYSRAVQ